MALYAKVKKNEVKGLSGRMFGSGLPSMKMSFDLKASAAAMGSRLGSRAREGRAKPKAAAAADGGAAEEKGEKGEELIHGCLDAKDMAMLKLIFAGTDEDDSKAIEKVGSIVDNYM